MVYIIIHFRGKNVFLMFWKIKGQKIGFHTLCLLSFSNVMRIQHLSCYLTMQVSTVFFHINFLKFFTLFCRFSWIHIDDLVNLICEALTNPSYKGRCFLTYAHVSIISTQCHFNPQVIMYAFSLTDLHYILDDEYSPFDNLTYP